MIGGVAYFTNLSANNADTITLRFTANHCNGVVSDSIVITPAALAPADRLVFTRQPARQAPVLLSGVQPVIRTQDALVTSRASV